MNKGRAILPGFEVLPPMAATSPKQTPSLKTRAGRFATLNAFVDASVRRVSGTAVKVWLILYRDTKRDGLVRASDSDVARRAGVSERTVWTARQELVGAGLLEVVRQGGFRVGPSTNRVHALAEAGFRLSPEETRHAQRKQAADIPEGTRKGVRPFAGSASSKDSAREPSGRAP